MESARNSMRESTISTGCPCSVRTFPSSVWKQSPGTQTVLSHPATTSTGGRQRSGKVTAHSPTANVEGSTAGGGSFVLTGFPATLAGGAVILVRTGSWAKARAGKASAHSNVNTKMQVILEDF